MLIALRGILVHHFKHLGIGPSRPINQTISRAEFPATNRQHRIATKTNTEKKDQNTYLVSPGPAVDQRDGACEGNELLSSLQG